MLTPCERRCWIDASNRLGSVWPPAAAWIASGRLDSAVSRLSNTVRLTRSTDGEGFLKRQALPPVQTANIGTGGAGRTGDHHRGRNGAMGINES